MGRIADHYPQAFLANLSVFGLELLHRPVVGNVAGTGAVVVTLAGIGHHRGMADVTARSQGNVLMSTGGGCLFSGLITTKAQSFVSRDAASGTVLARMALPLPAGFGWFLHQWQAVNNY